MTTVKIKFRASSVGMREGTLVYQVIHRRVTRQVTTGYKLYPQEWDGLHSEVTFPPWMFDKPPVLSDNIEIQDSRGYRYFKRYRYKT